MAIFHGYVKLLEGASTELGRFRNPAAALDLCGSSAERYVDGENPMEPGTFTIWNHGDLPLDFGLTL